jgi:hypothetical protein
LGGFLFWGQNSKEDGLLDPLTGEFFVQHPSQQIFMQHTTYAVPHQPVQGPFVGHWGAHPSQANDSWQQVHKFCFFVSPSMVIETPPPTNLFFFEHTCMFPILF